MYADRPHAACGRATLNFFRLHFFGLLRALRDCKHARWWPILALPFFPFSAHFWAYPTRSRLLTCLLVGHLGPPNSKETPRRADPLEMA